MKQSKEETLKTAKQLAEDMEYEAAINAFNQILTEDPNNHEALNGRGNCRLALEDYHAALKDFQAALQLNPGNYKILNNMGNLHHQIEDFESAIDCYSKAIQDKPEPKIIFNRGNTYALLKKFDLALKDYEQLIEAQTADFHVYANVGNVYEEMGKLEKALSFWKQSQNLNPEYFYVRAKLDFYSKPVAKKEDWTIFPMTENRIKIPYGLGLEEELYRLAKKGLIPSSENDKWFIYMENDALYCFRADSGYCIYELHFQKEVGEYLALDIFVEGNSERYSVHGDNEYFLILFLVYCGLCFGAIGPDFRNDSLNHLLEKFSFDELEDLFGNMLYS